MAEIEANLAKNAMNGNGNGDNPEEDHTQSTLQEGSSTASAAPRRSVFGFSESLQGSQSSAQAMQPAEPELRFLEDVPIKLEPKKKHRTDRDRPTFRERVGEFVTHPWYVWECEWVVTCLPGPPALPPVQCPPKCSCSCPCPCLCPLSQRVHSPVVMFFACCSRIPFGPQAGQRSRLAGASDSFLLICLCPCFLRDCPCPCYVGLDGYAVCLRPV